MSARILKIGAVVLGLGFLLLGTPWGVQAQQTIRNITISAALPAGNANIGDVDVASIAAGTANIGDVDVATIAAGDNNIGNVDIASIPTVTVTSDDQQADDDNVAFALTSPVVNSLLYVSNGSNWVRAESNADPCAGSAKTHIPIDIVTATTTELTSALAGASTNYYVCSLNLVAGGAQNAALVDDDTDNCASVTSGVAGGTTAGEGWNFAANGGLTIGDGTGTVFKTNGTNRVLCMVTSAAVQLSGSITVVAAP